MATMTIEGRRVWIKTQYGEACVEALKALGAKWDSQRKEWWLGSGKKELVEKLVSQPGSSTNNAQDKLLERDRNNIIGTARYEEHTYYLVGRGQNERGEWVRLLFRDGSKTFFKPLSEVTITKTYQRPQTLSGLQEYAERRKRERETGICECWCHHNSSCQCDSGFCPFHHDGCDSCGCES